MYDDLLIQSSTVGYVGSSHWGPLNPKQDGAFQQQGSKRVHISFQKFTHSVQPTSEPSETLDEVLFLGYTILFVPHLRGFLCLLASYSIFRLSRWEFHVLLLFGFGLVCCFVMYRPLHCYYQHLLNWNKTSMLQTQVVDKDLTRVKRLQ